MKRIELKKTFKEKLRLRFSRTGGFNASVHPVKGVTLNNKYGLRVSKSFKGLTLGFQGKNTVFRGRWSFFNRFLNINLSKKNGISLSTAFRFGAINWTRPEYSSFRFLGIQIRGKKAHEKALFFFLLLTSFNLIKLLINLLVLFSIFIFKLTCNIVVIFYNFVELLFNLLAFSIIESRNFYIKKRFNKNSNIDSNDD